MPDLYLRKRGRPAISNGVSFALQRVERGKVKVILLGTMLVELSINRPQNFDNRGHVLELMIVEIKSLDEVVLRVTSKGFVKHRKPRMHPQRI